MQRNVEKVIDFILRVEGGYVYHEQDPGGPTNFGITLRTYSEWIGFRVTPRQLEKMPLRDAEAIYHEEYWNVIKGHDLPSGLDLVVMDMAVNAGPSRAAKILQRLIGAPADGIIGPVTLAMLASEDIGRLIPKYTEAREAFYSKLDHAGVFLKGWLHRAQDAESEAFDLRNEE